MNPDIQETIEAAMVHIVDTYVVGGSSTEQGWLLVSAMTQAATKAVDDAAQTTGQKHIYLI